MTIKRSKRDVRGNVSVGLSNSNTFSIKEHLSLYVEPPNLFGPDVHLGQSVEGPGQQLCELILYVNRALIMKAKASSES